MRCTNPSTKKGGGGYGTGVWCVCDEHTAAVDATQVMPTEWRDLKPDDLCLDTFAGRHFNRRQGMWDPAKEVP